MCRVLLLAGLAVPVVGLAAAPVPPESDADKVARLWGTVEAPAKTYVVKPEGKSLTLRTLGWPLLFEYTSPKFHVGREVTGDFDVRVKLVSLDAPSRMVEHKNGRPETGAGLIIEGEGQSLNLRHWMAIHKDQAGNLQDGMQSCTWFEERGAGGGSGRSLKDLAANQSVYLRVVRLGKAVTIMTSTDGQKWDSWPGSGTFPLPHTVRVAAFVGHSTNQEVAATFSDFTITKPEKVEKK